MAIQERPLSQNELNEFADYTNRAMINLGRQSRRPNRGLLFRRSNLPPGGCHVIKACLDNPRADPTAMLAFNMLAAGQVSRLSPRCYENLMQSVHRIVPKR